jgi:hypothetical protein
MPRRATQNWFVTIGVCLVIGAIVAAALTCVQAVSTPAISGGRSPWYRIEGQERLRWRPLGDRILMVSLRDLSLTHEPFRTDLSAWSSLMPESDDPPPWARTTVSTLARRRQVVAVSGFGWPRIAVVTANRMQPVYSASEVTRYEFGRSEFPLIAARVEWGGFASNSGILGACVIVMYVMWRRGRLMLWLAALGLVMAVPLVEISLYFDTKGIGAILVRGQLVFVNQTPGREQIGLVPGLDLYFEGLRGWRHPWQWFWTHRSHLLGVPFWLFALLLGVLIDWRLGRRSKPNVCRKCGYSLAGLAGDDLRCPECGEGFCEQT